MATLMVGFWHEHGAHALPEISNKKAFSFKKAFQINPGGVLLSHPVTQAVPSTLEGLTSVFGMGTGVSPPPLPPETFILNISLAHLYGHLSIGCAEATLVLEKF
jgi:hypothetical protein